VYFLGPGERIELTHQAHSRENFAQGAVRAGKWLFAQKPGKLYSVSDMLEETATSEIGAAKGDKA
jgi:4-hydroxy-tetrahydrodipicolinate reductase